MDPCMILFTNNVIVQISKVIIKLAVYSYTA